MPNRTLLTTLALPCILALGSMAPPIACAGWLGGLAVGETHRLEPGAFYRQLQQVPPAAGQKVGVLPVALDREVAASFEYGDRAHLFMPIGDEVQARLASAEGLRMLEATALPTDGSPRVYVGSAIGDLAPPGAEESASPADDFPPMVLHVERASKAWKAAARAFMSRERLSHLIVVRVSASEYPKGRRGVFAKNLLLGTGYEVPVKFLTAEDKLMQVLQVTGLLVGADGQVLRAGAEGILGRDTPFAAQVFEVTRTLDDQTLKAAASTERRPDLPGAPLALEIAVDNLVAQLLQDSGRLRVPLP